jgi:Fe-S oxidoreductase
MAACPVGSKIDQVIMAFRHYVAEEKGIPTIKKVMLTALDHRTLCNVMTPIASIAERIPFNLKFLPLR